MKIILLFILRGLSWLDYGYRALVRWIIPYPYRRTGRCRRCGECCQNILIGMEPWMLRIRWLKNFAVWWNQYFNNLYLIGSYPADGLLVFSCHYLRADGRCGNYNLSRPVFCFEYPRLFKYFEKPVELKNCGFKFAARK
ncbi:MAG: YkgJ family cysteine cluster protein [Candidatus Margulisbacteria bacterium]|nr:YkgJ family cysteine cluster protein [Candidatus Margulisiibacteriota bacterium]